MSEGERTEYRRSPVGSEFQVYNLTPTFTAAENVAHIAEIAGSDAEVRHGDVLTQVGLDDRAKHSSSHMSAPFQTVARAGHVSTLRRMVGRVHPRHCPGLECS
ncbi:MAG: hypothetical protein E2O95_04960 [Acidobacteria bacterium]|nr:MAG: hypothetical protein E2O95_04960 [Acidobacteriota bacterium]